MSGYADLSGVDDNNSEINNFTPFVNFKWNNNMKCQVTNHYNQLTKEKIVLTKEDFKKEDKQFKILCYNGEIENIKDLSKIYDYGYRIVRLQDYIRVTKFNIKVLDSSNLIIDTYSMNEKNFKKLAKYTTKPLFLSIGNSKTISQNHKNASDAQIKTVKELNGVVGINITKEHLTTNIGRYDSFEYIFRHLDYLIELIGVDNLCFSAGFDNNNILPWEVSKLSDVKVVENWLKVFYGNEVAEKIMWKNAYNFLEKSLN